MTDSELLEILREEGLAAALKAHTADVVAGKLDSLASNSSALRHDDQEEEEREREDG
jgi:hypothetical protein